MKTTETIRIAFDLSIEYDTPEGRREAIEMALECENGVTRAGCFGLAGVKLVEKSGTVVLTPPAK
jgi:hypothetical protein